MQPPFTASPTNLTVLSLTQLKILEAFRSSPALSLCAEAGQPPLSFRRYTLYVKLLITIAHNPSLPMYKRIFESDSSSISNSKPHHHIKIKLEKFLNRTLSYNLLPTIISDIPFWLQVSPNATSTSQTSQNSPPPGNLPVPPLRNHQPIHRPGSMLHGWIETRNKNKLRVFHRHSNRNCLSL